MLYHHPQEWIVFVEKLIRGLLARRRDFTAIIAILVLVVTAPAGTSAAEPELEELDKPIRRHETNIKKLKSGIQIHLGKLQIAGQREFNLLDEIERIDRDLSVQKIRLDVMQERQQSQQKLLSVKLRELEDSKTNMQKVREHLQVRLRSYYLMGKTGILNVTFSTRALPELMLFNDSFRTLLEYDQNLIEQYRKAINQLTTATEEHRQESVLLEEYIAEAIAQQEKMDEILGEKRKLLKKTKTEKVLHEQALREMQKAEEDLQKTLVQLQAKKTYTLKGFALNKGKMLPPVSGTLVRRFGEKDGDNVYSGIIIDAKDGSAVKAIFAGRIIFAGYRRGYGNMVIIDHGLNYYSVTARLEKITTQVGSRINEGDTIGIAGDIATLFEKGLYFEIRRDTVPVDPLEWITAKGLTGATVTTGKEKKGGGTN